MSELQEDFTRQIDLRGIIGGVLDHVPGEGRLLRTRTATENEHYTGLELLGCRKSLIALFNCAIFVLE